MGFAGAIFAVSAATAVSQISQGYAQKSEANYNATLLEGKANLIDVQSSIEQGQITRQAGQAMSTSVATVAKQGTGLSGSALAVMLNTQKQYEIDKTISKFNYDQEKNYTMAEADAQRRAGKAAVRGGYANAFSSLLQGATTYAMYKIPTSKTTFDSGGSFSNTAPYKKPNLQTLRF